jgi:hypothetical protein
MQNMWKILNKNQRNLISTISINKFVLWFQFQTSREGSGDGTRLVDVDRASSSHPTSHFITWNDGHIAIINPYIKQ